MTGTGEAVAPQRSVRGRDQFITTLPGILAGLAALLTAVGTVIGVLWGTGAINGKKASGQTSASTRSVVVTLPYRPREGLVSEGHISASRTGPATLTLSGRPRTLWASFTLALLPTSDTVWVVWRDPKGKIAARIEKRAARKVVSFISAAPGSRLHTGVWHAQLLAGNLVIKDLLVAVRRAPTGSRTFGGDATSGGTVRG